LSGTLKQKVNEQLVESKKLREKIFSEPPPQPILPKGNDWTANPDNISHVELARQLTIMESAIFQSIKPYEFLDNAWSSKDKETKSPNLLRLVSHFNKCSNWVIYTIVRCSNVRIRTKLFQLFVKLAEECKRLNNYNGVFEVMGALQNAAIHRMKKTYEPVAYEIKKSFEEMKTLTLPAKSWKIYRDFLRNLNPPCVPFIGIYQTDLIFIEDGNPTTLANGLKNFRKCRMVAKTIGEIQQFQHKPYNLASVANIQDILYEGFKEVDSMTSDSLYEVSLVTEPRVGGSQLP